jgi:hypothetical protein
MKYETQKRNEKKKIRSILLTIKNKISSTLFLFYI